MSHYSFDVNIENYTRKEIEIIFELPLQYDAATVESKANLLIKKITNDRQTEQTTKEKVIQFIQAAKTKIISVSEPLITNIYNTSHSLKPAVTVEESNSSIIVKPATPYSHSLPSEFYQGVINPLKKRVITQQLNIDSRFREHYKITNPTEIQFDLPNRFSNIVSMELSTIQFSHSYYVISSFLGNNYFYVRKYMTYNGQFVLDENGQPKKTSLQIVIPDGNYIGADLFRYINDLFTASTYFKNIQMTLDANTNNTGSGRVITSSFQVSNNTSNSPYFHVDTNGQMVPKNYVTPNTYDPFILDFQSDMNGDLDYATTLQKKCGWIMGYRYGIYGSQEMINAFYGNNVSSYDESYTYVDPNKENINEYYDDVITKNAIPRNRYCRNPFTSKEAFIKLNTLNDHTFFITEGILDLSGMKYFYLVVNDYNSNVVNNGIYAAFQNSVLNNNILAKINVAQSFFTIDDQNSLKNIVTQPREYFGPVYIQKLNVQLLNEYGDLLDLNNMDFSFGLSFKILYDL